MPILYTAYIVQANWAKDSMPSQSYCSAQNPYEIWHCGCCRYNITGWRMSWDWWGAFLCKLSSQNPNRLHTDVFLHSIWPSNWAVLAAFVYVCPFCNLLTWPLWWGSKKKEEKRAFRDVSMYSVLYLSACPLQHTCLVKIKAISYGGQSCLPLT